MVSTVWLMTSWKKKSEPCLGPVSLHVHLLWNISSKEQGKMYQNLFWKNDVFSFINCKLCFLQSSVFQRCFHRTVHCHYTQIRSDELSVCLLHVRNVTWGREWLACLKQADFTCVFSSLSPFCLLDWGQTNQSRQVPLRLHNYSWENACHAVVKLSTQDNKGKTKWIMRDHEVPFVILWHSPIGAEQLNTVINMQPLPQTVICLNIIKFQWQKPPPTKL